MYRSQKKEIGHVTREVGRHLVMIMQAYKATYREGVKNVGNMTTYSDLEDYSSFYIEKKGGGRRMGKEIEKCRDRLCGRRNKLGFLLHRMDLCRFNFPVTPVFSIFC